MFNHSILLGNAIFKYDVMGNLRQNSFSPYSRCISRGPKITVIDENWKRSKCNLLGITFESTCEQPSNIVGRPLRDYEPSKTEAVIGDGNCLFRCLSKINTGSENSHLQLRCIISRFIASE